MIVYLARNEKNGKAYVGKTKMRMSEFRRGRPMPPGHGEKIALAQRGIHRPQVSKVFTGDGNPMYGRHHSDEAREKIGQAQYVRVAQYDMSENHVATYESMIVAEQATSISRQGISRCYRFPHRSANGFRFRYVGSTPEKE